MQTINRADAYQRWLEPQVVASIWWCGDEYCDCTEPVIERISPGTRYPWVRRERLWEGTFLTDTFSYSWEERERLQYAPLREECHRIGVPIPKQAIMRLSGPMRRLP